MASDSPRDPPPSDDELLGRSKRRGHLKVVDSDSPFLLRAARLPIASTLPPRPWLYGTQLLRGFLSLLVAPGGTGKSLYAMGVMASLAAGRRLLDQHIFERVNTAYINLEDPLDELERRMAAFQIRHNIGKDELQGHFWLNSGDERELSIARVADDGSEIVHPDVEALIRAINDHQLGALAVDPFAETHELEENSNPQMIRAAKAWRSVARATGCAILLVHHLRKGPADGIDSARGAKALTDSARVALLMSPMSETDAAELGIEKDESGHYVRLDNAKANMSVRACKASWYELAQVDLHNGTAIYPHGDSVAAIVSWEPPSVFGDLTVIQCNEGLDRIAAGPRDGVRYTSSRRGDGARWAGKVLVDLFGVTDVVAARMIGVWIKSGVLRETPYRDPEQRRDRLGLVVDDLKRPGTVV